VEEVGEFADLGKDDDRGRTGEDGLDPGQDVEDDPTTPRLAKIWVNWAVGMAIQRATKMPKRTPTT
jgi:hypothetical protein